MKTGIIVEMSWAIFTIDPGGTSTTLCAEAIHAQDW